MPEYVSSTIAHIQNELRKVIVGQDEPIEQVLVALLAEGHALIEGVPGTAKTLTVKTLARIINAGFGRIQFTPDLMPRILPARMFLMWPRQVSTCDRGRCSRTFCSPTRSIAR